MEFAPVHHCLSEIASKGCSIQNKDLLYVGCMSRGTYPVAPCWGSSLYWSTPAMCMGLRLPLQQTGASPLPMQHSRGQRTKDPYLGLDRSWLRLQWLLLKKISCTQCQMTWLMSHHKINMTHTLDFHSTESCLILSHWFMQLNSWYSFSRIPDWNLSHPYLDMPGTNLGTPLPVKLELYHWARIAKLDPLISMEELTAIECWDFTVLGHAQCYYVIPFQSFIKLAGVSEQVCVHTLIGQPRQNRNMWNWMHVGLSPCRES